MIYDDERDKNMQFGIQLDDNNTLAKRLHEYFNKKLQHTEKVKQIMIERQQEQQDDIQDYKIEIDNDQSPFIDDQSSSQSPLQRRVVSNKTPTGIDEQRQLQFIPSTSTIQNYLESHPLSYIDPNTWFNIPLCVKQALKSIVQHCMEKDMDAWEKKTQINEQFFKLQHMFNKLDQRRGDNELNFNKTMEYHKNQILDKMKKEVANLEQKIGQCDEDILREKRNLVTQMEKVNTRFLGTNEYISDLRKDFEKHQNEVKEQFEQEKLFLTRLIDRTKRELLDNYLMIVDADLCEKKTLKQFLLERMQKLTAEYDVFKIDIKDQVQQALNVQIECLKTQDVLMKSQNGILGDIESIKNTFNDQYKQLEELIVLKTQQIMIDFIPRFDDMKLIFDTKLFQTQTSINEEQHTNFAQIKEDLEKLQKQTDDKLSHLNEEVLSQQMIGLELKTIKGQIQNFSQQIVQFDRKLNRLKDDKSKKNHKPPGPSGDANFNNNGEALSKNQSRTQSQVSKHPKSNKQANENQDPLLNQDKIKQLIEEAIEQKITKLVEEQSSDNVLLKNLSQQSRLMNMANVHRKKTIGLTQNYMEGNEAMATYDSFKQNLSGDFGKRPHTTKNEENKRGNKKTIELGVNEQSEFNSKNELQSNITSIDADVLSNRYNSIKNGQNQSSTDQDYQKSRNQVRMIVQEQNQRYQKYQTLVSKIDQSEQFKKQPIINTSSQGRTNVSELYQSYLLTPSQHFGGVQTNHFAFGEQSVNESNNKASLVELHQTKPINLQIFTFDPSNTITSQRGIDLKKTPLSQRKLKRISTANTGQRTNKKTNVTASFVRRLNEPLEVQFEQFNNL